MRDAVGGTWLLYFFLIFIFIYVSFMAVVMNYASAYRANNYIISKFEEHEGEPPLETIAEDIRRYYDYIGDIEYCCSKNSATKGVVYRVQTAISFEIPLVGVPLVIPITNDSKTVYDGVCNTSNSCS